MSKLLRADFTRLWKSRIFRIGTAFMAGAGVLSTITQYREMKAMTDWYPSIDHILFSGCLFMVILSAVFIGLFVGTEYSDGTIRNKLIVGHTRAAVYFSNLIVCTTALFIMHLAYIAVIAAVGYPVLKRVDAPIQEHVISALISIVTVAALAAVFLLMSMLVHNKAVCCVAAMLLAMAFLMSGTMIQSRLNEKEYYSPYSFKTILEDGKEYYEEGGKEKNPYYLTGTKRQVYEFLYDFLPGCQMVRISYLVPENREMMPVYSLFIMAAASAGGVFFFRRKNIK